MRAIRACTVVVLLNDVPAPKRAEPSPIGRPPAGWNGEKTSTYPQLSLRLPPETLAKVRELSRVLRVPQWRIIADAIDAYAKRYP